MFDFFWDLYFDMMHMHIHLLAKKVLPVVQSKNSRHFGTGTEVPRAMPKLRMR